MRIIDGNGRPLLAELDIRFAEDRFEIVLHANGGGSRGAPPQNPDYISALETLLTRLKGLSAVVQGIWVDSKATSHLPLDQRAIQLNFPIEMRFVPDVKALRLGIRRSVSRIGGGFVGSIGTGNKRIKLVVSTVGMSPTAFEEAISGREAIAAGYWFDTCSLPRSEDSDDVELISGDAVAQGHLVIRVEAEGSARPRASIGVWYVDAITHDVDSIGEGRSSGSTVRVLRLACSPFLPPGEPIGPDGLPFVATNAGWNAIDEATFRSMLSANSIAPENLVFPISRRLHLDGARGSRLAMVAAPIVRERISRYVERGPVGDLVKAANGYRCQLCVALGLPGLGFPRVDDVPFVEAHHVVPVSTLEEDVLGASNVIAVCPNHHRQLHFGGVVAFDEGDRFRFEFPFDHPDVWVSKTASVL